MNAVKNNIIRPTSMQARFNDLRCTYRRGECKHKQPWEVIVATVSLRHASVHSDGDTSLITNVRQTRLATFSSQRNSVLSLVISRRDFCRLSC